jgi:hypothetical protein
MRQIDRNERPGLRETFEAPTLVPLAGGSDTEGALSGSGADATFFAGS